MLGRPSVLSYKKGSRATFQPRVRGARTLPAGAGTLTLVKRSAGFQIAASRICAVLRRAILILRPPHGRESPGRPGRRMKTTWFGGGGDRHWVPNFEVLRSKRRSAIASIQSKPFGANGTCGLLARRRCEFLSVRQRLRQVRVFTENLKH